MWNKFYRVLFVVSVCTFCLCSCGIKEEQIFFASQTAEVTYEQEDVITGEETAQIMVYVCGAVCEPGVFALNADARSVEAIAMAGGMTELADVNYINLAAKLQDGEKLYVPTREETLLWQKAEQNAGFVNINTATSDQLCTLPGIGESKAADIIAYREKYGDFTCKEDIMKVGGIKESLFAGIEELIIVE